MPRKVRSLHKLTGLKQNLDQEATQRKVAEQQASHTRAEGSGRSSELQSRLTASKEKGQLNSELGDVALKSLILNKSSRAGMPIAGRNHQAQKQAHGQRSRIAKERDNTADNHNCRNVGAGTAGKTGKEEEINRLTRTQEELSKSLQDEISKGNITIQQVRDHLTINMVDRVLFDSGQAQVKPAGVKVLKPVSDILNKISDKQIRIEGHTDNLNISPKLQDRFKTNWELSTARATTVVRYLIDQGGVDRQHLSAVGYADTHPLASNETEQGRASNRRIEIVLYPKDSNALPTENTTSGTKYHPSSELLAQVGTSPST